MFPNVDPDVCEVILQANQGHIPSTIEALLDIANPGDVTTSDENTVNVAIVLDGDAETDRAPVVGESGDMIVTGENLVNVSSGNDGDDPFGTDPFDHITDNTKGHKPAVEHPDNPSTPALDVLQSIEDFGEFVGASSDEHRHT